jgi:hypothetical protein
MELGWFCDLEGCTETVILCRGDWFEGSFITPEGRQEVLGLSWTEILLCPLKYIFVLFDGWAFAFGGVSGRRAQAQIYQIALISTKYFSAGVGQKELQHSFKYLLERRFL